MSWISGSKLGSWLLAKILDNKSFQASGLGLVKLIGERISALISNPDQLMTLANNLRQNPEAVFGAMVKGTEAEKFVDPKIVKAADQVVGNPADIQTTND